ncbi:MAG: hypothetical protein M1834_003006 [Cirrosporium novae-zelandiae]|nr:MAG: hypothetical protein M1834_003006 [Cirrosporium novae-zelandiae]
MDQIRLAHTKLYAITGIENVLALLKNGRDLTTTPLIVMALENSFGSPKADSTFYLEDDTGLAINPLPNSKMITPENRIQYLNHKAVNTYLSGKSLRKITEQFLENLADQISKSTIGSENWTDIPDIYAFIRAEAFRSSILALCGPHILSFNPTFMQDFWEFDYWNVKLFKNFPRWLIPRAYQSRDKLHQSIKAWHAHANAHYDWPTYPTDTSEWEPNFGARVMRARQKCFTGMPLSADAIAAADLGMIWGTMANAIPAICWCIFDILARPALLARVRDEITPCLISAPDDIDLKFDIEKLCRIPLLQSIYAEELRLRVAVMVCRSPPKSDFQLAGWKIRKNAIATMFSWTAARDKEVWNTGNPSTPHPVDEFWEDRFIVYPNDSTSGPLLPNSKAISKPKPKPSIPPSPKNKNSPYFSIENMAGAWIPYGGGQNMCPGRHFAKQEIIGSIAMFLTAYDIELTVDDGWTPQPDMSYFMFGTLPVKGKISARIRRRKIPG